ncbi:MAG TPA: DUF2071 domain-containing protein [Gemmatimonadaceae bacterium]|nr:DUF2071 domain-containing protein [Gemmatimonadaceae bacterium]
MTLPFLTAQWRYLAMLNYEVDPAVLAAHLPKGTLLDDEAGRHYVSLIGFLFLDTHVFGLPAIFHQNFEEVNLRFYVRRELSHESHHGVVFVREVVSLPLIAQTAKLTYNEPYTTAPTQHTIVRTNDELQTVEYLFGARPRQCRLALHVEGVPSQAQAGSHEQFITQRPWGFTRQRDGGTIEYAVDHPPWSIWRDARSEVAGPFGDFYPEPFSTILTGEPTSAFVADGSPIAVHLPHRIA